MLVLAPSNERLIRRSLDARDSDLARAVITGNACRRLEESQRLACIRTRQAHEAGHGLVRDGETPRETPFIGQRTADQPLDCIRIQGAQRQEEGAREQRRNNREGRILRRCRDEHNPAILNRRK